jgi:phospholipase C
MKSEYWNSTVIFVTWDDYGGWYDHVAPPQVDAFGYGFRAPCLIISPYARQGFIDHTRGDFTSFLRFIETMYSLPPLTNRDGSANSLMEAFDFSQPPRSPLLLPGQFIPNRYPLTFLNGTLLQSKTSTSESLSTTSTTTPATIIPLAVIASLLVVSAVVVGLVLVLVSRRVLRTRPK